MTSPVSPNTTSQPTPTLSVRVSSHNGNTSVGIGTSESTISPDTSTKTATATPGFLSRTFTQIYDGAAYVLSLVSRCLSKIPLLGRLFTPTTPRKTITPTNSHGNQSTPPPVQTAEEKRQELQELIRAGKPLADHEVTRALSLIEELSVDQARLEINLKMIAHEELSHEVKKQFHAKMSNIEQITFRGRLVATLSSDPMKYAGLTADNLINTQLDAEVVRIAAEAYLNTLKGEGMPGSVHVLPSYKGGPISPKSAHSTSVSMNNSSGAQTFVRLEEKESSGEENIDVETGNTRISVHGSPNSSTSVTVKEGNGKEEKIDVRNDSSTGKTLVEVKEKKGNGQEEKVDITNNPSTGQTSVKIEDKEAPGSVSSNSVSATVAASTDTQSVQVKSGDTTVKETINHTATGSTTTETEVTTPAGQVKVEVKD